MKTYEVNFDGLVGPTHNYAGLSVGNVASMENAKDVSNPKEAALQGLKKMKALFDLGFKQGVLAPQERPDVTALRRLGFNARSDAQVIQMAAKTAPHLLAACYSASSMWTANAATISPSADTGDGKVHFTPANLVNKFHRSLEPETTSRLLKTIFPHPDYFFHHAPLPGHEWFGDEGAANHTRFCGSYGEPGVEFFTFGRYGDGEGVAPKKFPARQTFEASSSIARSHQLKEDRVVFGQQNPDVIDEGVFHNDVIGVGNANVLFYHEKAYVHSENLISEIRRKLKGEFFPIQVLEKEVSVPEAVVSYLFNSQLLSRGPNDMILVVPEECRSTPAVWDYLQSLTQLGTPIREVKVYDVKQSMRNGGGPACLRLRIVLSDKELAVTNQKCLFSLELYGQLVNWVNKHYRDRIAASDLADPQLLEESRRALDELTTILNLGSFYGFQNP